MNELRSETFIMPGYLVPKVPCVRPLGSDLKIESTALNTVELLLGRIFLEVCQLLCI